MQIPPVRQLAPGLYRLDLHLGGEAGVVAAYLLDDGSDAALIETGPASSSAALLERLEETETPPERISHLIVTHIHLDHSGGAGTLLGRLPDARVVVHPRGAPHLEDPSRLLKSARRIYGDRTESLWGEVVPVPTDRLVPIGDGETIRVAGRTLRALHTPGHASHHHAFHDLETGGVFAGDVAGIRLAGSHVVRPPTPPPEIDLAAWAWSISRLRALSPRRLYLTHFDAVDDPEDHLDRLVASLHRWTGRVEAWADAGLSRDDIAGRLGRFAEAELREAGASEALVHLYEFAIDHGMITDGILRAIDAGSAGARPPTARV